jgi:glycosyltransferase involved in cell wall biosynthesis
LTSPSSASAPALRLLHVIAGVHPDHGGAAYSAPSLSAALARAGADVALYHVGEAPGAGPRPHRQVGFAQSWARTPVLSAFRLSQPLEAALLRNARGVDVIHNHGLWLAPNLAAQRAARRAGAAYVCSPRGMLSPEALAFSRLRKQAVWRLWQRSGLAGAACLHATSEAEWADLRALGLRAPVAVAPNGVEVPPAAPPGPPRAERTLLSLGRVHPKKDLVSLLRAWARLEARHANWRLRIVGPAERGHDAELRALIAQLRLERATIEGAVHGEAKLALYRASDLFVLPTLSENFGLTVAEALAAGVPVVSTRGAPWSGLETHRCGWWVDRGPDALAAALDEAMASPAAALREMGERGRRWVSRDFGWERIAEDMIAVYLWLSRGAARPAIVHVD